MSVPQSQKSKLLHANKLVISNNNIVHIIKYANMLDAKIKY